MAISIENMVGYLRTRPKPGQKGQTEVYVDPVICYKQKGIVPVVSKPPGCCGILYSDPLTGKLRVEYPEEDITPPILPPTTRE